MKKLRSPRVSHTEYFVTYNEKGKILREISASSDNVRPPPLRPGEFLLTGVRGDGITQKVIDGKVVDKTAVEMAALKKANPGLRFDRGEKK